MAEHKIDNKPNSAMDLASIGTALPKTVDTLDQTIEVKLPSARSSNSTEISATPSETLRSADLNIPRNISNLEILALENQVEPSTAQVRQVAVAQNIDLNTKNAIASEVSIAQEISSQREKFSPLLNPSLKAETFSYANKSNQPETLLDTLMNLLAELLTRIDRLLFRRKPRNAKPDTQTARETELDEFIQANMQRPQPILAAKKAGRTKEELEREEKEKQLTQQVGIKQDWQGGDS